MFTEEGMIDSFKFYSKDCLKTTVLKLMKTFYHYKMKQFSNPEFFLGNVLKSIETSTTLKPYEAIFEIRN